MKIANVVRRFAFEEWGGTETVVWNTARQLKSLGHHPDILCTSALSGCKEETPQGINIRRYNYFYPNFPMSDWRKRQLDKKGGNPFSFGLYRELLSGGYDLVHCHTMARLARLATRAAHQRRVPLVLSFHGGCYDVPATELAEMMRPLRGTFNYGKFIDLMLGETPVPDLADGIICVGLNEYEIAKAKFTGMPVTYLPNGVDIDKFNQESLPDFRLKHSIPPEHPMALCVSRIDYQKNQKLLVSLSAAVRQNGRMMHTVIIGPPTAEQYYKELLKEIADAGLSNCFTVIPGLASDDPELIAAYKAADVFILPSLHEPFGIVVLEAWAAELPVIAANVGGLGRLVENERTGLQFDPASLESLYGAWIRLQTEPKLSSALAIGGAAEVKAKYSWQTVTAGLLNFYQEVIESHAGKK